MNLRVILCATVLAAGPAYGQGAAVFALPKTDAEKVFKFCSGVTGYVARDGWFYRVEKAYNQCLQQNKCGKYGPPVVVCLARPPAEVQLYDRVNAVIWGKIESVTRYMLGPIYDFPRASDDFKDVVLSYNVRSVARVMQDVYEESLQPRPQPTPAAPPVGSFPGTSQQTCYNLNYWAGPGSGVVTYRSDFCGPQGLQSCQALAEDRNKAGGAVWSCLARN